MIFSRNSHHISTKVVARLHSPYTTVFFYFYLCVCIRICVCVCICTCICICICTCICICICICTCRCTCICIYHVQHFLSLPSMHWGISCPRGTCPSRPSGGLQRWDVGAICSVDQLGPCAYHTRIIYCTYSYTYTRTVYIHTTCTQYIVCNCIDGLSALSGPEECSH